MQGFYRNHMEEVIKFLETQHKVRRTLDDCSIVNLFLSLIDEHNEGILYEYQITAGCDVAWQGKYKVYNLCSERLYDASLLEGKVCRILQIV